MLSYSPDMHVVQGSGYLLLKNKRVILHYNDNPS